jgi:hypothetical protein
MLAVTSMGTSLLLWGTLCWGTLCWGTEYPVTDGTLKVVILPANRRQWLQEEGAKVVGADNSARAKELQSADSRFRHTGPTC